MDLDTIMAVLKSYGLTLKDMLQILIVPIALAAFGYVWPFWLARTSRNQFLRLIRREMKEMNPRDDDRDNPEVPWWQLLRRRFIHENGLS